MKLHSGTILYDISDHLPILCTTCQNITNDNSNHIKYIRNFTEEIFLNFSKLISQGSRISVYEPSHPEHACNYFIEIFHSYYQFCFPLSKKYTTSNKPRIDWCTPGIVKSCKTKCRLYEIFIHNPTNLHKQIYVSFRNRLNQIIRISKQEYYFNIFNDCNKKRLSLVLILSWGIIKPIAFLLSCLLIIKI